MIEKVRSIAIVYVLTKRWWESCRLISAPPADGKRPWRACRPFLVGFWCDERGQKDEDYSNFTQVNPVW